MDKPPVNQSRRHACILWLKKWGVSLAGLILALGLVIGILVIYLKNPELIGELQRYGYFGAFIVSIILNGTILIPASNMAVIVSLGATLPVPLLVGIAGGAGAGIGEFTGYLLGRSGRALVARDRMYNRIEKWVGKWGWVAVVVLSVFPMAFDVVGIISGVLRMPAWKFFLACTAGRTISYSIVAYLGSIWLNAIPWWAYILVFAALIALAFIFSHFKRESRGAEDPEAGVH